MEFNFYNSLNRRVEKFLPLRPNEVSLYCCGPTVYNYAHIGNLRTYVFEDILRRALLYNGYRLNHVMNITDVGHLTDDADQGEDKIEKSARASGKSVWEIADFYTRAFFSDCEKLNIERPETVCRATGHIPEMIELAKRLEQQGFAYSAGGNLYFDSSKFERYDSLFNIGRAQKDVVSRVAVDQDKRNSRDFVLWFTRSRFNNQTMQWDSPWGRGYPGWHIECSAMSMKYLGESFDIHCGGIDHLELHHPNEIAQSEAASGKRWVNYWLHGEFLLFNKAKMSKSGANFHTLDSLRKNDFVPLDFRYFCLGAHYRSQLTFSDQSLAAARSGRLNLSQKIQALHIEAAGQNGAAASNRADESSSAADWRQQFLAALTNDLNTPQSLAVLWQMLKDRSLTPEQRLALVTDFDRVLALDLSTIAAPAGKVKQLPPDLQKLFERRLTARRNKEWLLADQLRQQLLKAGIAVEDNGADSRWRYL